MSFSYVPREAGDGMMRISQSQAQALAAFVSRIRPDWDHPGIVAAIAKAAPIATPADIGVALCRLAANLELRTPALLAEPGAHWQGTVTGSRPLPIMCPLHPSEKTPPWCRQCADDLARTDQEAGIAEARAALASAPRVTRPVFRAEPKPRDLSDVRNRADKEVAS